MPRYINADDLKHDIAVLFKNNEELIDRWLAFQVDYVIDAHKDGGGVDLVRCKDCLHYENGFCYNPNTYDDEKTRGNTIPNWFCADGKRREDVEEVD